MTSIGEYAFSYCSALTSLTIGSGIKDIGFLAFAFCPKLTDVYCLAVDVPSTNTTAFNDSHIENATLYVPAESVNDYNAADPWKNFKEIIEGLPVTGIKDASRDNTITESRYYTLDGRTLDGVPTKKGIYIVNGRSVVMKK